MARLSLSLLGPFQATLDGTPLTGFPSAKVRALLAYLAVESGHGRPGTVAYPREVLAGLLWPDYPEPSAHTNLSNALSHLRTLLQDRADTQVRPYILVDRETAQFNPESDCWVDVAAFVDLATRQDPSALEEAVALYRGPFLEGFSLHDSPPFEQWALVMRERLQRQMLAVLRQLAEHHESCGGYEQAIAYARRQLELDPSQEEAHRDLMRLLALSGQRSAALAQYEACVRALKEELGVEPAPETVELYETIRANRPLPAEGVAPAATVPAAPVAPKHYLPAQSTPFVGREQELAGLDRLLADPQVRLVTVVGPGGSGKTRLALEAAARQVGRYEHGVWFASLAALQSVESIVPAVAQAVGLQFYPGSEPRQQLLDYLREKRMLLVLDNWEHLLEGANLLADLLAAAPRVQVLATSRARLNLQGEQGLHLEGMRVPAEEIATEDASQYSAVQLFLQSARRVGPDLRLEDDLIPVVHLCRLVEGIPLALVLAASWVEMLSPAEIAVEIERSLDFLAAEWRDLPERQRSVRAVFDHSWRLLSEREQAVFASLAVFRGGFTREAAEQLTGADLPPQTGILRTLVSLMNKSFLERDAGGRYQMHELLRQYGEEKLGQSPDGGQAVRDRHGAHYAAALGRWAEELKGPRQLAALAEMDVEIDNTRAAWDWAVARGWVERLVQGMEGLGWFYAWRGRKSESEPAFRTAADRLASAGSDLPAAHVARQRTLARLWAWQSWCSGFVDLSRRSLAVLDNLGRAGHDVRPERAFALSVAGTIESYNSAHRTEAKALLEESLALYRALGARWETAWVLHRLAHPLQALGYYGQAEQARREALAIRQELGDHRGMAESLIGVGWVLMDQGELSEAERLTREGLALYRAMDEPIYSGQAAQQLGAILAWQGRFAESYPLLEEALAAFSERGGLLGLESWATAYLSQTDLHLSRYAEAERKARASLALARDVDARWTIGLALLFLGGAAMAEGAYPEARQRLQESLVVFQDTQTQTSVIQAHADLAATALLQGNIDEAQQHLLEALRMVTEYRCVTPLLFALPFLARLLAEQGKSERAVEIYALASRYPYVANSRWYADLVGQRIAEVAATLPPEVVVAAQERGRARDLWATVEELLAELEG